MRGKFKVWDKWKNKWATETIYLDSDGEAFYFSKDGIERDENRYDIVFFTGFNDKNEKMIFEGDILRQRAKSGSKFKVYWGEDGAWMVNEHDKSWFTMPDMLWRWCKVTEIIGNIYESPELFERWGWLGR